MKSIYTFIILSFLLWSCGEPKVETTNEVATVSTDLITLNSDQLKSVGLQTGKLQIKKLAGVITVKGKIDVPPQNLISVSVPMGGYLKSTKLLPGMQLRKGEIIAVMEDEQYIKMQEDYLTTKINLETAKADYLRQKELNENQANSDKTFQQAKANYQSLKIALSALGERLQLIHINSDKLTEQNLSRTINLYAPFDGFVAKVNANIGKYIAPSEVLFELVNPTDIHLNLSVFEKDLMELSIGQEVIAFSNSNPESKHDCKIILISQNISEDHSAEIHCHFDQYDKKLLPGMYMNAEIQTLSRSVQAIQEKAVVNFEGKYYIFVQEAKGKFRMKEVFPGKTENGWIELLNCSYLSNAEIVTDGAYALLMTLKNQAED